MTNTAWRIVLAAYAAFWFLAIAIERHGFAFLSQRGPMTAVDLYLTAPFFFGYVIYALQSGLIHWSRRWRITSIERDDRPVAYWLIVAVHFLYGVFLIVLGLNR